MNPQVSRKIESEKIDAAELERVLEVELIQKRAAWQRATTRYRTIRTFSLFLLVILVVGVIAAFLYLFSRINEKRENQQAATPASESSR